MDLLAQLVEFAPQTLHLLVHFTQHVSALGMRISHGGGTQLVFHLPGVTANLFSDFAHAGLVEVFGGAVQVLDPPQRFGVLTRRTRWLRRTGLVFAPGLRATATRDFRDFSFGVVQLAIDVGQPFFVGAILAQPLAKAAELREPAVHVVDQGGARFIAAPLGGRLGSRQSVGLRDGLLGLLGLLTRFIGRDRACGQADQQGGG
jgi:hypothetical protein